MEFKITEKEAREFAQVEESAGGDVGAGFDWGTSLGKFLASANGDLDREKRIMQATEQIQHLDAETAKEFLAKLPAHIRQALLARAVEINYPVEAVLESAIAASLDPDALSFVDCKPPI